MNDSRRRRLQGSSVTVNAQRYIIKSEIGAGGSYLIYLAEPEEIPNQRVVIREFYPIDALAHRDEQGNLHFDELLLDTYREEFCREQNNAIVVTGEITQATAAWSADPNTFCAVMQMFSGDSKTLYELLTEWEDTPPDTDVVRLYISLSIISALLSSLETLHTNVQRLHCDLSYYNVKVSGNLNDFKQGNHLAAQIFDFGSMVELDANHQYRAASMEDLPASTPFFRPCEMEGCPTVLSPATDLYSVTVLLYSLVCGHNCKLEWLWSTSSNHQRMVDCDFFAVKDDLEGLNLSDVVRSSLFRILKKGLALEPQKRYQTALEMQKEIDHLANWIRPFQIDDLRDKMYLHNRSIHDHNGIYHLGVQHEVSSKLFSKLSGPEKEDAITITSTDNAPPLYHYLNDSWNSAAPLQHLILSGEGGSGKTTSLLETAALLQEEAVPVLYIPMNALTAQAHPLECYLEKVVFPTHENALGVLRNCCCQQRNESSVPQVVFFLDGVNEINDSIRSEAITDIQTWMGYDNLQIVVAGRSGISNYQAFFKENTLQLQIQPLEEGQVVQYLGEHGLLPADPDAISVLYNPLMLVLYVNTALYQKENPKLANSFRPELTQGAILWNYIEAQVIKNSKQHPTRVQEYAIKVAAHYAAAWIGWAMGNQYALDKAALIDTLDEFFKQYDCWKNISELKSCGVTHWQPEPYELVELLTEELCVLAVDKGMYSFQHQIFRDYYAAAAMEHDAMLKNPEQSELWKCAPSYTWNYVRDLLAGLLTEEKMDQIWNSMRGVDVEQRSYSMYKLVDVAAAKNKDDLSNVDFSEMDLRTVSLTGKRIDAKDKYVSFKNARIGETTFTNKGMLQELGILKASPDGKTLAMIGDGKGCFIDAITGYIIADFPIFFNTRIDVRDICWSPDSSYISFWGGDICLRHYKHYTVDLTGHIEKTDFKKMGTAVSILWGQNKNSIIKLFHDFEHGLYLAGYSLNIKGIIGSSYIHHAWTNDRKRLFLAWEMKGGSTSSERMYRFSCFDLEKDRIVLQVMVPFDIDIDKILSSPDGKYLLIENFHYGYYLLDVQNGETIRLIHDAFNAIWTVDGAFIAWCVPHKNEIGLFQLDNKTFQKIQLDKIENRHLCSIDSFIRENKSYLVWYGYEDNGIDWNGSANIKEIIFETYCLQETECLPIRRFLAPVLNGFNWIKNANGLYIYLGYQNGGIFQIDLCKRRCESVVFSGEYSRIYSPNGDYFVQRGNTQSLWEVWNTGSNETLFKDYSSNLLEPAWLADSSGFLIRQDDVTFILRGINGQRTTFHTNDFGIKQAFCSPNGNYICFMSCVSMDSRGTVSIYDRNNELIWSDTSSDMLGEWHVEWSCDDRYILYHQFDEKNYECKLKQLDLKRNKIIQTVSFPDSLTSFAWAYKKNLLAFSTGHKVYLVFLGETRGLIDALHKSAKLVYECYHDFIDYISFSPDEEYLALSDINGCLYVLKVEDSRNIFRSIWPRYIKPFYLKFEPLPGINIVNADFTGAEFSSDETRELIRQNGGIIDNSIINPFLTRYSRLPKIIQKQLIKKTRNR